MQRATRSHCNAQPLQRAAIATHSRCDAQPLQRAALRHTAIATRSDCNAQPCNAPPLQRAAIAAHSDCNAQPLQRAAVATRSRPAATLRAERCGSSQPQCVRRDCGCARDASQPCNMQRNQLRPTTAERCESIRRGVSAAATWHVRHDDDLLRLQRPPKLRTRTRVLLAVLNTRSLRGSTVSGAELSGAELSGAARS
jgi:hypothetical protein